MERKMMKFEGAADALGVIDVQPTFMPGGEVPVPGGDEVVLPINRLLERPFGLRFATQDWHPFGNASFASSHPGRKPFDRIDTDHGAVTVWPDHAIQGTTMAEMHLALARDRFDMILRKGARRDLEGYSAFSDLGGAIDTGLSALMRARGIKRVFLAGLALDVCVAATAEDAARAGFETFIIEDACRAGHPEVVPELKRTLQRTGVTFIHEADLAG